MFSIPNILTYLRIILIPVIMILLLSGNPTYSETLAVVLFGIAAISDFFDGYFARKLDQISEIGRFLDPIADKLIVVGVLLILCATGKISEWHLVPVSLILFREILVSGIREYLGNFSVTMPVSNLAKWKTATQLTAIPFLIYFPVWEKFFTVGLVFLWLAAGLTVQTGWQYLKIGYRYMKR
ncbi:MAG: CDP-diacylglycerol--glycerol-3-phosphate 3-phosphatidyltransferase [Alphaproteobacteria bacterium]|nr:CDP-diacylglycerol--glycerol-3-phosphate 3-phosphatidyltransferase [Alphaproteobacteria bacterium]